MPPQTRRRPKRLFFALIVGFLIVTVGASLFSWYLVAPRLAEWHAVAPTQRCSFLLTILLTALGVALALVALMLLTGWPRSTRASSLARRILAQSSAAFFWLGRVFVDQQGPPGARLHSAPTTPS